MPPASALRDATTGALIMPLEKGADPAALKAAGWNPVTTIKMKGRDGTTDIYGVMYKPADFDPSKKYPIINQIYPGPQSGSNGAWGWTPAGGEASGLANLGFIVVKINGMGTPDRDKKFHDAYYAKMGDNTLPDQVAGMKELAQKNSWIDIDKAGIWGHSGGGFATADAMFRYPDFFKVGISESGNHDNREYEDDWGERYQGLETRNADGTDSYTAEANEIVREEPEGAPAAGARHDGQQRAAVQHAPRRRRADQGQQGFRSPAAAEQCAWIHGRPVHAAPALGLLRALPAGRRAAEGV